MTIRDIVQNSITKKWAYVETSDEDKNHILILGGDDKEFDTKEEALDHMANYISENGGNYVTNLRNNSAEWLAPEISIFIAIQDVESMGADVGLTKAIMLLTQAKQLVSNYIIDNKLS